MPRRRSPSIVAAILAASSGVVVPGAVPGAVASAAETAAPPPAALPSLAQALAAIRARAKIDLTRAFDEGTPMPAGFAAPRIAPAVDARTLEATTIARNGVRASFYSFAGPSGTHVVAPAAVAADGRPLGAIALDEMILPLVVMAADPSHSVSPADLAAFEAAHGRVPDGALIALRDGSSEAPGTPGSAGRTTARWSREATRILIEERGVVAFGCEEAEAGTGEAARAALTRGRWIVSGLDHLDAVPPTGAAIVVSWPAVSGGYSFPARAYAVLP